MDLFLSMAAITIPTTNYSTASQKNSFDQRLMKDV